jgi:hypothetical protein
LGSEDLDEGNSTIDVSQFGQRAPHPFSLTSPALQGKAPDDEYTPTSHFTLHNIGSYAIRIAKQNSSA